jgi:glyceraldehyde 3-phosphate dehydrogenase
MILGVNEKKYLKTKHKILSSSICDATAIAPVLKILNENFKIINGSVTTIHPALNYQNLLDNKCVSWSDPKNFFNTYALGRSTVGNIIPKNTTALEAVCQAYKGISPSQLISFSYRTENLIVASADLTINLKKKTTKKNIQKVFKDFEKNQKFKIIKNINEPLVSLDFKNSKFSCNVDHRWIELNKNTLKMILWYDNEAGYSSNLVNQIIYVNSQNLN